MTIHGSIYDYDAIHRALGGKERLEFEVRPLAGPNWNPPHLRQQAARLYQIIREPIAWCENPTRFGWGEPGLTWWCTSILAHDRNWSFPVDAELRSLGPVELPSTWRVSHRSERKSIEIFDSFDAALAALSRSRH